METQLIQDINTKIDKLIEEMNEMLKRIKEIDNEQRVTNLGYRILLSYKQELIENFFTYIINKRKIINTNNVINRTELKLIKLSKSRQEYIDRCFTITKEIQMLRKYKQEAQ